MATIHDRLTEIRSGVPFRRFADAVKATGYDVEGETVRKYELGPNGGFGTVPVGYVAAVCRMAGVRLDWLVHGEEPKHPVPLDTEIEGFRQMAAIADEIRARAKADAELRAKLEAGETGEVDADEAPRPMTPSQVIQKG